MTPRTRFLTFVFAVSVAVPPSQRAICGILTFTVLLFAGCGGSSPTSPSLATPPLPDGTFLMEWVGDSYQCQDIRVPNAGTSVSVLMAGTHDASGTWIAHPLSSDGGNVEIRMTRSGPTTSAGDFPVAGTWSGNAIDSFVFAPSYIPYGSNLAFGDSAPFTGSASARFVSAGGYSSTPLVFTRNGLSATCPAAAVEWSLNVHN
jgi:hypothetical protein